MGDVDRPAVWCGPSIAPAPHAPDYWPKVLAGGREHVVDAWWSFAVLVAFDVDGRYGRWFVEYGAIAALQRPEPQGLRHGVPGRVRGVAAARAPLRAAARALTQWPPVVTTGEVEA